MTDNTQAELDEILIRFGVYIAEYANFGSPFNSDDENIAGAEALYQTSLQEAKQAVLDWHNKQVLQARLDTATDILYGFSRTYKQEVTDTAGNVYVNDSHGYISKYEVQELVEKLKQEQRAIEAERNKLKEGFNLNTPLEESSDE